MALVLTRGADARIDVRFRGFGDLSSHALALLDVDPLFGDRLAVEFVSYTSEGDESLVRVTVEGTAPIDAGRGRFRIQATLDGVSVSTRLIEVQVL